MSATSVVMIAAMNRDRVIGKNGRVPWHRSLDLRRFKALTMGHTVVMGRRTFESIGRVLPGRTNVVVTSRSIPGVITCRSIEDAIRSATGLVWLIGGARIFEEGMGWADEIDLTIVPDAVEGSELVRFPPINPSIFEKISTSKHDDPELEVIRYARRRKRLGESLDAG
ncbi:MAG: dihydrofolate reductase [Deltaproteobacteria bacterium]|nr:dihydrofolate reductase [Deltaproteobacteria bacterium]